MIKKHNVYIPNAGNCFMINGAPMLTSPTQDVEEVAIDMTNIEHLGEDRYLIDGKFQIRLSDDLKRKIINVMYTNDDQIAIMLNGDDTELQHMQAWRAWISELVKALKGIQ